MSATEDGVSVLSWAGRACGMILLRDQSPEKVNGNGQYLTVQFKDAVLNMHRWGKWRVVGQNTGV